MERLRPFSRITGLLEASWRELWGSVFDLWFLVPVIGLMAGAERGGSAHALGRDFLFLGGAWLFSALLFRTPLPLQPLKVWAFLFLILRPTPFVVSLSATLLGILLFVAGRSGLVFRLEMWLGNRSLAAVRRAVGFYVRAVGALSLGLILLHILRGFLPAGIPHIVARLQDHSPGTFLSLLLLVLPQFPVTLINGVLSTVRERQESGMLSPDAALSLTGSRAAWWLGLANMAAGILGVLPFCHGSGGLWIYRRHGIRSLLPTFLSSAVLIVLGSGILLFGLSLPGPAFFTVFLVGFLLAEFFLKDRGKRKDDAGEESSGECLSGDPLGFFLLSGGMISGAVALGGLPLALVFLFGMNAALAISKTGQDAKVTGVRGGIVQPAFGNPVLGEPAGTVRTLAKTDRDTGLRDLPVKGIPGMKWTCGFLPAGKCRGVDPHCVSPGIFSPEGMPGLSLSLFSPGFFRRAREIVDIFVLCALFCLFFFFLSYPLLLFSSIESDTVLQKILFIPLFSPRAP